MRTTLPKLLPSKNTAKLLGVPESWLIDEARAGRLPAVDANGVFLFEFDATEAALVQRARAAVTAKEASR